MTDATFDRSDDATGEPATLSVSFSEPIAFKGGSIEGFVLREPLARHMREAEKERTAEAPWAGEIAYELRLIILVAGLSPKADLPIVVINHCMNFLNEFIDAPPDDDENPDEDPVPVSLPLDPPITWNGVTYFELDLREPLGSEIRNARLLVRQAGNIFENRRSQMHIVTTVSGLPAPVIEGLPIRTLDKAGRILGRFTRAGRATGKR